MTTISEAWVCHAIPAALGHICGHFNHDGETECHGCGITKSASDDRLQRFFASFADDITLELATAAHNGTSHSPDVRGKSEIAGYRGQLTLDYVALLAHAHTPEKFEMFRKDFDNYRRGYAERYRTMLTAKSRCLSTMIAGPSNFNTRKHGKASDSADARTNELIEYRKTVITAIRKDLQPELRPVMAGDEDAVDRLKEKIEDAKRVQKLMRDTNVVIRRYEPIESIDAPTRTALIEALAKVGHSKAVAESLLEKDELGRRGYASYQLTNNNANLTRMLKRLDHLIDSKSTPTREAQGERARFEDNAAENRVRLFFPGKPDADTRTRLKSAGFRWAPSIGAWQAYRNDRSVSIARREAGLAEPRAVGAEPSGQPFEVV